jgi:hypothetical protein
MRALLETLAAIGKPHKNPDADGRHYTVVPSGWLMEQLPVTETPARAACTVKLRDAASFIRWYSDHKVARSRVYAQLDPARFLAVVDELDTAAGASEGSHREGEAEVWQQADWRGLRAEFAVPPSREWQLWTKANRQHMSQLSFAEFLQDNLPDVTSPAGGDLLQMTLNFEAAQAGSFVAAQRLQDGSHNLTWKAENNASGTVKLPEFITLQIPVFENEQASELSARLRYRVKEGQLALWYELVRPHKVLETAFRATWQRIESEAGAVMLLGAPE